MFQKYKNSFSFIEKIQETFLILGLEYCISQNMRNYFGVDFFVVVVVELELKSALGDSIIHY